MQVPHQIIICLFMYFMFYMFRIVVLINHWVQIYINLVVTEDCCNSTSKIHSHDSRWGWSSPGVLLISMCNKPSLVSSLANVLIVWCQKPELSYPDRRCPLTLEVLTLHSSSCSIQVRTHTARVHIAQVGRAWDPNCSRIPLGTSAAPWRTLQ